MTIRNLDALLSPRSIALIGATDRPGSVGATIARNLAMSLFEGSVHFVSPRLDRIQGKSCHRSIGALPEAPDLAVVATPPATVVGLVEELAARGTRAIATITAGLDAREKQRMLEAGRGRLVRVLGPNSIGLMLPRLGVNASFAHCSAPPGDLAFLSQSGALITAVVDWACARRIGFSHVISLGDMADVDFGDLLDYLAGDTASRAILLYMEAVTHAPKFMSAARRAARVKPVIAIKAGRHATAARAAASHTGRLAGSDAAYEAAFRRAGVLRVTALDELFDAAEMLARVPRLVGERLMILTNGGGAGVLAADHLADESGTLAELSSATRTALDGLLPPTWSKANPVDIIGDAGPQRYATYARACTSASGHDGPADVHNLVTLSRFPISAHSEIRHQHVAPERHAMLSRADKSAQSVLFERPLLVTEIELPSGASLAVVNLHLRAPLASSIPGEKSGPFSWRTMSGWAEGFYLSALKRVGQALELRLVIGEILRGRPDALIAVAGDFNAEDHETPLRLAVGATEDTGSSALAAESLVVLDRALPTDRRWSVLHDGQPQMLDHILASQTLYGHFRNIEVHNETLGDELLAYEKAVDAVGSYHAGLVATFDL